MTKVFNHKGLFALESGVILDGFHLAYTSHGTLNEEKNNVVWIFHALTANSDATEWWPGMVGKGKFFDPAKYFIICVNVPGSCYGSIGPLDISADTHQPYYHNFPFFTTRDMIRSLSISQKRVGDRRRSTLASEDRWVASNYWNGRSRNLPYLNTLPRSLPMLFILPGALHSMLHSDLRSKRMRPGRKGSGCRKRRNESSQGHCSHILPAL